MVCRFLSIVLHRNRSTCSRILFLRNLHDRPLGVDFLTGAFGFSQEEAARVSARLDCLKPSGNPESLLDFFKAKGVGAEIIRDAISRRPSLLYADVENNLAPKFKLFEELGLSGTEFLRLVGRNGSYLRYSLEKKLIPNIEILQAECGISSRRIFKLLWRSSRLVGRSTTSLMGLIIRVRELGFSQGSIAFETCLHIADSLSLISVNQKMEFLRSQGLTEEETLRAIRKYPLILGLSLKKLRNSMEFFVKEVGCDVSYVVGNAVLLTLSIEKRVKPRYRVYKILREMKLPEGGRSLVSLFSVSEPVFLDHYVLRYATRYPHLKKVYDNAEFATKL